ncbi:MAG: ATP-binding protein [Desulfobacterales bacterium]|nr:ATP-binding protein [Desulfobacterales bacterium]
MNELLRILSEWNLWWETGKVSPELAGKKRQYTAELVSLVEAREVKVLTGVRRSGKSTLFYQLIEWLLKEKRVAPRQILLVNFEDEGLTHFALDEIFNAYQTHLLPEGKIYLFLDEVQEKAGWERWVRKQYDLRHTINFFATGSSASLLGGEYATLLTGRNLTSTIYPLSFNELVSFSGIQVGDIRLISQDTRNRILGLLIEFMREGGFPEIVFHKQNMKRRLLNQYFHDIIYKDIVNRHGCHPARIRDLASYLMTNISALTTLRALRGTFGYGLNVIGEYLGYLEDAFLVFQLYLFDYSMKKQLVNPRKVYGIDNGLRNAVAFKFSQDMGRLMENVVFMELKRRSRDIYYWKDKRGREVDFVVRKGLKIESAIQVCSDPEDKKTNKREMTALEAAMREFDLKEAVIITLNVKSEFKEQGRTITFIPLYEWLLS